MWASVGYGVAGLAALLMLTGKPQRMPKVAVILALVSGFGIAGWASGLLAGLLGLIEGFLNSWVGVSVLALTFFYLLYMVINGLMPKLGSKVQGGSVSTGIAVMAFLLPTFAALSGGAVGNAFLDLGNRASTQVAQFADRGF